MYILSKYENKWCIDDTTNETINVKERVYQWFMTWRRLIYSLTALNGTAYGSVQIANVCIYMLFCHASFLYCFCVFLMI